MRPSGRRPCGGRRSRARRSRRASTCRPGAAGVDSRDRERLGVEALHPALDRRRQRPANGMSWRSAYSSPGSRRTSTSVAKASTAATTSRRSPGRIPRPGTPSAHTSGAAARRPRTSTVAASRRRSSVSGPQAATRRRGWRPRHGGSGSRPSRRSCPRSGGAPSRGMLLAFSDDSSVRLPSPPTTERMPGSNSAMPRTSRFGTVRVGTFEAASPRRSRRIAPISAIQRNCGGRDEALAAGFGRRHRPDLEVGDVSDVDQAEAQPRHPGRAVQEPLNRLQRVGEVVVQHRPDDGAGVDDRQAVFLAPLAHQVPGRPLGDRLRANVGRESRAVGVRPVALVERPGSPHPRLSLIAATEEVTTTRFTPASRPARRTRRVPSRAGTISSSGSFGCLGGNGEATCRT